MLSFHGWNRTLWHLYWAYCEEGQLWHESSHVSVSKHGSLCGCDAISLGKYSQTFWILLCLHHQGQTAFQVIVVPSSLAQSSVGLPEPQDEPTTIHHISIYSFIVTLHEDRNHEHGEMFLSYREVGLHSMHMHGGIWGKPETLIIFFKLEPSRCVFTKYSKIWFSQNTTTKAILVSDS